MISGFALAAPTPLTAQSSATLNWVEVRFVDVVSNVIQEPGGEVMRFTSDQTHVWDAFSGQDFDHAHPRSVNRRQTERLHPCSVLLAGLFLSRGEPLPLSEPLGIVANLFYPSPEVLQLGKIYRSVVYRSPICDR
jgi:hypothetical protein